MGFQPDIKTMIYLFIFGNIFTLLLITTYRISAARETASTFFIGSKWLQLFYWCSLLLWDTLPRGLIIPFANLLILLGGTLEITALLQMMDMFGRRVKLYYLALMVGSTLSYGVIAVFFNHSALRITLVSLWSMLFFLYPAYRLILNPKGTSLQRILGCFFAMFAVIMLGRAAVALLIVPDMNVFTVNLSQSLYYLAMYLLLIVGTAGFILLSNERSHEKLKRLAAYDELTGILSRRAFLLESELKLEQAVKKRVPISLLLLDLDNFKVVNDTYGHDMGDEVLRLFALTVEANLGNDDLFGRVGGEEFAILLYGLDEQGCDDKAETLRRAVQSSSVEQIPSGSTVSIGAITLVPGPEVSFNTLYKQSDQALYRAKQEGRNRIVRYR